MEISPELNFESASFNILPTAEAFRILSCGLYSNKPAAVLRELGTNAVDAHKEAGTLNKPFEVHIPTYGKLNFKIRDYGTGLKHEDIIGDEKEGKLGIYRCYFGTNKLDKDDLTGQLGLGSKSPFCMTESFTVNSYVNGNKRTYVVEYGEDGIPRVNAIDGSQKTEEPNGLEISFPVKQYDIYEFQREAKEIYKYFEVKPRLLNVNFSAKDLDYKIVEKGSCWELTDSGNFRVIMGNVCYPINTEKLGRFLSIKDNFVLTIPVIVKLKNKEVDIVPSREALAYTRKTVDVLKSYIDIIHKEIVDTIQKHVDSSKDIIEARHNLINMACDRYKIGNLELFYKGKKINCHKIYDIPTEISTTKIWYGYTRYGKNQGPKSRKETQISYTNKAILVEKDVDKGHVKTAYEYIEQSSNQKSEIYIFDFNGNNTLRQKLLDDLGLDELKKFTEVFTLSKTKKQSVRYIPKVGNAIKWNWSNRQRYGSHSHNQQDTKIELDKESGYYIPYIEKLCKISINGAKSLGPFNLDSVRIFMGYIKEIDQAAPPNLFLVNSWHLKKFQGHKNWIDLSVYINELLKKWSQNNGIHSDYDNIVYRSCWKFLGESKINVKDVCEDMQFLIDICTNKNAIIDIRQYLTRLRHFFGIPQTLEYEKVKEKEEKVLDKYPLMKDIFKNNRYYFTLDKHVVEHLKWYVENFPY